LHSVFGIPISENEARLCVRVYPNANRNEIVSFTNGVLRVKVSAPPIKGKANAELIGFLSRLLDTSRDGISIVKGYTNRNKLVVINGVSQDSVFKLLLTGKDI
jgi:hypothetical protein